MNKKSIFLCVILMLLCITSGIAIGMIVSNEGREKDNITDNENSDNTLENDGNQNMDKKLLTITEFLDKKCFEQNAEECVETKIEQVSTLINNYRHHSGMLMENLTEDMKNDIAAIHANGKNALCQDYFDLKFSNCYEDDEIKVVKYDDLLNMKKKLFGEKSTLEKKDFNTNPIGYYKYFSNIDSYVFGGLEAKDGQSSDTIGIIRSASSKDNLYIATYEIVSGVDYDGVHLFGYTFKKANNNYYLEDVQRLSFDN